MIAAVEHAASMLNPCGYQITNRHQSAGRKRWTLHGIRHEIGTFVNAHRNNCGCQGLKRPISWYALFFLAQRRA